MKEQKEILDTIVKIIHALGEGQLKAIDPLIDLLKTQALRFQGIEEELLDFIQQVEIQRDYDPQHLITQDLENITDRLIERVERAF